MAELRGDFGKGSKDKIALQHARVRDLKRRCVDHGVAVEEDVEVDEARPVGEGLAAAHAGFDSAESGEEFFRRESGAGFQGSVEEPRLVQITDGFRLVKTGEPRDGEAGVFEKLNGSAEIGFAVADVRAESDVDRGHQEIIVSPRDGGRAKA